MFFCGDYDFLKTVLTKKIKQIKQKEPLSKLTFVVHTNQQKIYLKETLAENLEILANTEFYTLIDISKKLTNIEPLGDFEKELILKKLLYDEGIKLDTLSEDFNLLLQQLKEYQIPFQKIKSNWVRNILTKYQIFLKDNGYFDREDVHELAIKKDKEPFTDYLFIFGIKSVPSLHQALFKKLKKLTKRELLVFAPFIFDSGYYQNYNHFKEVRHFYETLTESFAVTQKELDKNSKIASYLFKHDYNIPKLENHSIKIMEANSEKEEIENVAKEIIHLVINGVSWDKICIIIPDFNRYLPFLKEILNRYYIPYYLAEENRYINSPNYRKLYMLFEIKLKSFSKESILHILSKTLFSIPDIEQLEAHIISLPSIEDPKQWQKYIKNPVILSLIQQLLDLPDKDSIENYVTFFDNFIKEFIKPCEERAYLEDILFSLKTNSFYKTLFKEISYEDFTKVIKTFFQKENKTKKQRGNIISVLKPTGAEGNNFEYIFFVGLNQDIFPKPLREELLTSPLELNNLDYKFHIIFQQLANFSAIFDKNKNIYLSYLTGSIYTQQTSTSTFLEEIKRILYPDWFYKEKKHLYTPKQIYLEKEFRIQYANELKEILKDLKSILERKQKYENPTTEDFVIDIELRFPMYATDFQLFAVCPYRFFLEKILQIEEYPILDRTKIPPYEKGLLIHEILKEFFLELDLDEPIIDKQKLKKQFYEGINDKKGINHFLSQIPPSYRPFEERRAYDLFNRLILFLQEDIDRLKAQNIKIAKEFLEKRLKNRMFIGRLDRVDQDNDNYYIYDYKTGETPPKNIKKEVQTKYVQLIIYKQLLEQKGKKVKHIGIISINDKTGRTYYTVSPTEELDQHLKEILHRLISKNFTPIQTDECNYCQFLDICPKDHLPSKNTN
ncbi:MAG: Dna2/Cas4 domain-containing protein [Aquificae bacterium]|nr:Dna2/Cas4 domain-containing protein [Aquificota bacterium]